MNIKGAPYHHTLEVLNNFSSPSFSFAHFSQLATIERESERERERESTNFGLKTWLRITCLERGGGVGREKGY